jgi:hypothetical protein
MTQSDTGVQVRAVRLFPTSRPRPASMLHTLQLTLDVRTA